MELAKEWGAEGLEHFVISDDPRFADRALRVACEQFLHGWAHEQTAYRNINTQRGYRSQADRHACVHVHRHDSARPVARDL